MSGRVVGAVFLSCLALISAFASTAAADTQDIIADSNPAFPSENSGWQAGTCNAEPPEPGAELCSIKTPDQFFDMAAAHPNWGFTQFIIRNEPPGETPVGELKTVRVDLPVGLSVNPGATERCPLEVFEDGAAGCEAQHPKSEVGKSQVTASLLGIPTPPTAPVTEVPVFNVEPVSGEAARFGLELAENEVFLEGDVDWDGDYHEGFTIHVPAALPEALGPVLGGLLGQKGLILKNRLVFNGRSGDGTFITTPTTCFGPAYADSWAPGQQPNGPSGHTYSTYLRADSVQEPDPNFPEGSSFLESPIPPTSETSGPGTEPKECESIPYDPAIEVEPGTAEVNSPAGATVDIDVPNVLPDFGAEEDEQASSHTKDSTVTLPVGMGLNPSAANGLKVCTDEEFGKGSRNPVACPPESRVGTVEIESPPLVEENEGGPPLKGPIYVGKQLDRNPLSGNLYRIFINAVSERYGVDVRLVGNVKADPRTGQLSTTIANTPQVPVTSFEVRFDSGARAVLSSPPTCSPNQANAAMVPWAEPWAHNTAFPSDEFTQSSLPGGGPCPKTMAERPFSPSFGAGPQSPKAGAFSPISIQINRGDGQQELKGTDIVLPPGMTGSLRGIPYCSEAALATAAGRAGEEEKASSSCPAASQVGNATVAAGTGSAPLKIDGKVFLSGPYNGAPLSLAVVTPATAGPFDLGTVVVRVALFVDPETAQIRALSDPIPHVFGGTLLSIRSVDLKMDRPNFTLNPTSCEPFATSGALNGGGGDPNNPASFSSFGVNAPFQASDCGALKFRPKLFTKLIGSRKKMRRNGHPAFQAVLVARKGDANIKRAALTLPRSQFLDQSHIGTICTRVQLAASACPRRSIYGYAWAESPLLDEKVAGPVYLTSSDNELPDLLADLKGQVNVRLRGVIDSQKRRMRTVFSSVPDVPVSKFVLRMKGGRKGLLVNSQNLCGRKNHSILKFKAQNGKKLRVKKLPLRTPACKGKGGKGQKAER
jgi:hypothetical protein